MDDIVVADDQGLVVPEEFGEEMYLDERGIVHTDGSTENQDDRRLDEFEDS